MVKQSKAVHLLAIILIGILTLITLVVLVNVFFVDLIEARPDHATPTSKSRLQLGAFFWMVGIVGGCIATTLTYVGWKKYKQEKHNNLKNKNQSVD